MPCTRSMVRSESKPSKPNARAKEEMPPPPSETKTQRTRVKKASKQPAVNDDIPDDVSNSPSLSASSTKSSRTRTKAKTKPADKPQVAVASPPRTRPTRSTRQNTSTASKISQETTESDKKIASSTKPKNKGLTPVVMLTQMGGRIDSKASKSSDSNDNIKFKKPTSSVKETKAKKGRGRGRSKIKEESDDTTTESEMEVDVKPKTKTLSLEEVHKCFTIPLKMAISLPVCEAYQRCIEKITDTEKQDKLDKQFQQLMNSTEMPPPLPPGSKAKGKGAKSKKRVRSPEQPPTKIDVPASFDFKATKEENTLPAMKRIMLDAGSSDIEGDSTADKNDAVMKNNEVEVVNNDNNLNETYVCKTPTTDGQGKQSVNQNTTFTPDLFSSDTIRAGSYGQMKQTKSSVSKEKIKNSAGSNMDISEKVEVTNAGASPSPPTNSTDLKCKDEIVSSNTANKIMSTEDPEEAASNSNSSNTGGGIVSSLVNFFDKKKELAKDTGSKSNAADNNDDTPADLSDEDNLNATYVLPPVKKINKGPAAPASMMNVTVDMNKPVAESFMEKQFNTLKNFVMPSSTTKSNHIEKFREPEALSRTYVKEPANLASLVEEDEEQSKIKKSDKPKTLKNGNEDNLKKKGISTSSSSSSTSSMKSASSQPCLVSKSKLANLTKNAPSYGSAGKLNDAAKSKQLEDAQKRKEELLQQKKDNQKIKTEEWKKKVEKTKQEEEKKQQEKLKVAQVVSSGSVIKKPVLTFKPVLDSAHGPNNFQKPKANLGLAGSQHPNSIISNLPPQLSISKPIVKQPFSKPAPPPVSVNFDMEESFKTASNSFLDGTLDGHLSSYDITVYEDLDDDMKHRQNKTFPHWASDKEALKEALYSMILLPDYQYKMASSFPKPDKHYKLFPNK